MVCAVAPSVSRIREVLSYDASTGELRWLVNKSSCARAGMLAGHLHSRGYIVVEVDGYRIFAHVLAYVLMTGMWPVHTIDHKDVDQTNNRGFNLREATPQQQAYNKPKQSNNTSGFKGVSWDKSKNKWAAAIRWDKKRKNLGTFPTAELAAEAYQSAARSLHGEFARF